MLADALVSGFGVFAGTWQAASGAAAAELATLRWLRELFGLPEAAGGLFVDGGSSANLYGLVAARRAVLEDRLEGAVLYASDQTRSWIGRAAGLLGLQPSQVRLLASDHEFRLPAEVVAEAVATDRAAGRRPFCVVATSGTTSTGSVDPLADLAALCRAEGLWFHVDGAFGAPAILTAEGRRLLAGIEQADSLALVSFRFADHARPPEELEAVNRRVADAMLVDELATVSSTVLDGRTTLRLCTVNPRTTREDVEATLARVEELAATV
jgi:glutamate/tyrosine decarboxylase-like PLP-dependent enzyme